jgi:hypothetical protein
LKKGLFSAFVARGAFSVYCQFIGEDKTRKRRLRSDSFQREKDGKTNEVCGDNHLLTAFNGSLIAMVMVVACCTDGHFSLLGLGYLLLAHYILRSNDIP